MDGVDVEFRAAWVEDRNAPGRGETVKASALILAGPNGSGKSTLAETYARRKRRVLISADQIAAELPAGTAHVRAVAGRTYYARLRDQIARGGSFVVETTLSGRGFLAPLRAMREAGYLTSIAFLFFDSEEACFARVAERVRKGGHDVRPRDLRRVFRRSAANFWELYRHRVDSWHLLYNGGTRFREIALGTQKGLAGIRDDQLFDQFLQQADAMRERSSSPPQDTSPFLQAMDLLRSGNRGAHAAQLQSRKAGIPNVYILNGVLQYELARGSLSPEDPLGDREIADMQEILGR